MHMKENSKKRYFGIDILKIIAAFMVIVLHVDGYFSQYVNGNMGSSARFGYQLLETTAYPAIHIFVLCGAFLMQSKKRIELKQYIYIYLQMFFIVIVGLLVVSLIDDSLLTKSGIAACLFPFSFRAYGFVSSWIILMILSPFLNKLQHTLSCREHLLMIIAISLPVMIMPTFIYGVWQNDYMSLFILLYLISGYAYRNDAKFFNFKRGLILWGGCWILLIGSYYFLSRSLVFSFLITNANYFYQYNCLLVIGMAVGIFMVIGNINGRTNALVGTVSSTSLFIYLIHMHPIVKRHYVEWGLYWHFRYETAFQYIISTMTLAVVVFLIGMALGIPYVRLIKKISVKSEVFINHVKIALLKRGSPSK